MAKLALICLGGCRATLDTGEALTLPTKKAWALLAYLAMRTSDSVSRHALASLLWADRPDDQARTSLRKTLYELRTGLGAELAGALHVTRETVALSAGVVDCDAANFDVLCRKTSLDELDASVRVYQGPFLDGLETGQDEFDRWQQTERTRLADLAVHAFGVLASNALDAAKPDLALMAARKLLDIDPLHEEGHRLCMRALAAGSQRNEALKHYRFMEALFQRELQSKTEQETIDLCEHIRLGSRFLSKTRLSLPHQPSVVVLPFDNMTGDPDEDHFVDGFTENVITELSRDRSLFVIARHSAFVYRGRAIGASEVASELGVRYLLEGSLQTDADRMRITAQLNDGANGAHVWAERYDRQRSDLFDVQDDIVRRIVATLRGYKGAIQRAELQRTFSKPEVDLTAYENLMRGMMHKERFLQEDMPIARKYFEAAIALEPDFAMAYGWLAWTFFFDVYMGWVDDPGPSLEKTFAAARKALQLDPGLDFAHWALGAAHLASGDHAKAMASFEQALQLNPNNSDVLANTAWPLTFMGQPDQAIRNIRRAIRLNPYYPDWYVWGLGIANFAAQKYADAVNALEQIQQQNSQSLCYLAASYALLGQPEIAHQKVDEILDLEPDFTIARFANSLTFEDKSVCDRLLDALGSAAEAM